MQTSGGTFLLPVEGYTALLLLSSINKVNKNTADSPSSLMKYALINLRKTRELCALRLGPKDFRLLYRTLIFNKLRLFYFSPQKAPIRKRMNLHVKKDGKKV